MRISALILSAAAVLLQGAWSQRLPVSEPTTDAIAVDESSGTEQVAINRTDANPPSPPEDQEQPVPISAVLFDGPPGPKDCRGNVVLNIGLTKPGAQHSTPTCYNIPGVAQCGNFVGNKDDGCEGRVFSEPDCKEFANVAVFVPEVRAFGGYVRSIEITCGIVGVAPPPLKLPGLKLPPNAVQAVG